MVFKSAFGVGENKVLAAISGFEPACSVLGNKPVIPILPFHGTNSKEKKKETMQDKQNFTAVTAGGQVFENYNPL